MRDICEIREFVRGGIGLEEVEGVGEKILLFCKMNDEDLDIVLIVKKFWGEEPAQVRVTRVLR